MSQHEQYTVPPGFSVSGGSGGTTKMQPVLIDPAAPAIEGDVITRVGAGYAPQAARGLTNAGSVLSLDANGALKGTIAADGVADEVVLDLTTLFGLFHIVKDNRVVLAGQDNTYLVLKSNNDVALGGGPGSLNTTPEHGITSAGDLYLQLGTGRQLLVRDLPTSDPAVVGALWNNAGTLKISAG